MKLENRRSYGFFSYFVPHNHSDVGKQNKHSCDVFNKVFTSNKALNKHKRSYAQ